MRAEVAGGQAPWLGQSGRCRPSRCPLSVQALFLVGCSHSPCWGKAVSLPPLCRGGFASRVPLRSLPLSPSPGFPWVAHKSLSLAGNTLSPGAIEAGEEPTPSLAALGDAKAFRSQVGRAQGATLQCGRQVAGSQSSGPPKDDGQPGPPKEGLLKPAPPDTGPPKAQEGCLPEKPREEETGGPESSEEGLSPEGDARQ